MVTASKITRLCPGAKAALVAAVVDNWDLAEAAGIDRPLRIAHFFARIAVETGGLKSVDESLNYTSAARIRAVWPRRFRTDAQAAPFVRNARKLANHVYANRMGNGPPESDDGWNYRGGGMMQTTGRAGFRKMGFEKNPGALRDPVTAFRTAVREWVNRGCNAMADRDDVVAVCKAINGGTHGLDQQRKYLAAGKRIFASQMTGLVGVAAPAEEFEPDDHVRADLYAPAEDAGEPVAPEPAFALPADPSAPMVLDEDQVLAVQNILWDLGYFEVGKRDGHWGTRTTAAVSALQKQHGLAVTGGMNRATWDAVMMRVPRKIAPERAEASAERVREMVPAAKQSWLARMWATITGVGAAAVGAVSGAVDAVPEAAGPLKWVRDLIGDVPPWLWAGLVAGVCLAIYAKTRNAGAEITDDYQSGRRA